MYAKEPQFSLNAASRETTASSQERGQIDEVRTSAAICRQDLALV